MDCQAGCQEAAHACRTPWVCPNSLSADEPIETSSIGHSCQWELQWALMTRWLRALGQAATPMPSCRSVCDGVCDGVCHLSAASSASPCARPSHLPYEISGGPMYDMEPVDRRSFAAL